MAKDLREWDLMHGSPRGATVNISLGLRSVLGAILNCKRDPHVP